MLWHVLNTALTVACFVILGVIVFDIWKGVSNAKKRVDWAGASWWKKTYFVVKETLVVAWTYTLTIGAASVGAVVGFCDIIGEPTIGAAIQQYIDSKTAGYIIVGAMVLSLWAKKTILTSK